MTEPLINGRPPMRLGDAPWIRRKPVCETCTSSDRAELINGRVLCSTCAEEES